MLGRFSKADRTVILLTAQWAMGGTGNLGGLMAKGHEGGVQLLDIEGEYQMEGDDLTKTA